MLPPEEGMPMNRNSTTRIPPWRIVSVYVPKRDGRPRFERVIQILLDPRPPSAPRDALRGRHSHESSDLCPGLDPATGPRPDDREPARGPRGVGRPPRP